MPTQPMPKSRMPLILSGVAAIIVIAIVAVVAIPALSPKDIPITRVPEVLSAPTPFQNAQKIQTSNYTINIPREWIPPQGFYDESDADRQIHLWEPSDLSVYVALVLPNNITIGDASNYQEQVSEYSQRVYKTERGENLTLIDQTTAPDGTIRQSYRLTGPTTPQIPPGQLDVFYLNRSPELAIVEMYSSDGTGNSVVPIFQQILDSVQIEKG